MGSPGSWVRAPGASALGKRPAPFSPQAGSPTTAFEKINLFKASNGEEIHGYLWQKLRLAAYSTQTLEGRREPCPVHSQRSFAAQRTAHSRHSPDTGHFTAQCTAHTQLVHFCSC